METDMTLERALEELAQTKRELREARAQFIVQTEEKVDATNPEGEPVQVTTKTGRTRIEYPTDHPHIYTSPDMHRGEPTIRGSAISVRTIVERSRLGDSAEQILEGYPHLNLAKIYDAMSYYYDHAEEIDKCIRENEEALWRAMHPAST